MAVYLSMLVLSLFCANCAQNTKPYPMLRGNYRILAICSALPFIVVSVIRNEVGIDWNLTYAPYYYYINAGIAQFKEIGFTLLNRFLYLFTEDPWILFAVVGLLTNALMFAAIYRLSDNFTFSILLYFLMSYYFQSLNQIRQMLAMAIYLYALKYVFDRNWKAYFLWIALACSIHESSIMYFLVYFLYGRKATVKKSLVIFFCCAAGAPVIQNLITFLISHTSYGWYLSSIFSGTGFYLLGFVSSVMYWSVHLLHLYRNEKQGIQDKSFDFMSHMALLSVLVFLFSSVIPQSSRLVDGISIVQIFSIPKILNEEKNRRIRVLCFGVVFGICIVKFLYDTFVNAWHGVLPYQTIFQS